MGFGVTYIRDLAVPFFQTLFLEFLAYLTFVDLMHLKKGYDSRAYYPSGHSWDFYIGNLSSFSAGMFRRVALIWMEVKYAGIVVSAVDKKKWYIFRV